MRLLKGIVALAFALLLLLIGILLTVNNQQLVSVDLVFVTLPEASLARWLILSFMLGAIFSFLLGVVAIFALRTQLRQSRHRVRTTERELDKLRTARLNQPS